MILCIIICILGRAIFVTRGCNRFFREKHELTCTLEVNYIRHLVSSWPLSGLKRPREHSAYVGKIDAINTAGHSRDYSRYSRT